VAPSRRLIVATIVAVILIIAGLLLTTRRRSERPAAQSARRSPGAWVVGIASAVAASLVVITPYLPTALLRTLTILVVEAAAVIAVPPAFESASIVIVRISNGAFAALAVAAVWIAARRVKLVLAHQG
jgi:hypothetical protein